MNGRLIEILKWCEPIGQFLVLLAIGLQVYKLEPARTYLMNAEFNEIKAQICTVMTSTRVDVGDIDGFGCHNGRQGGWEGARLKKLYTPIYASIFFFGGLMVVVGKSASIMRRSQSR